MEHYIKILPKYKISVFSKYSFDPGLLEKEKNYLDIKFIPNKENGEPYPNGGYVKLFYGENKLRFRIYKNSPNFGNCLAKFETMEEAVKFIESIKELNNNDF